jgi:hypothetical protein
LPDDLRILDIFNFIRAGVQAGSAMKPGTSMQTRLGKVPTDGQSL